MPTGRALRLSVPLLLWWHIALLRLGVALRLLRRIALLRLSVPLLLWWRVRLRLWLGLRLRRINRAATLRRYVLGPLLTVVPPSLVPTERIGKPTLRMLRLLLIGLLRLARSRPPAARLLVRHGCAR